MSPSVALPLGLSTLVPNSRLIVLVLEEHVPARHTAALPCLNFLFMSFPLTARVWHRGLDFQVGTLGPLGHHWQGNEHTWHLQNVCSVFITVANNRSWINEWPILRDIDHLNGDLPGGQSYKQKETHLEAENGLWIKCTKYVQSSAERTQPGICTG